VSDRHDNIGMDPVARAIAEQGGASFLLDAGDDTSTGGSWEAFSLESLDEAFDDFEERFAVAGNHDNGDFVSKQAKRLGFTTLDGEVVDGPAGMRLLGVSDPRSSGLGTWRDERGISFEDQEQRLTDLACEHDADGDRINTLLVHDANSGRGALNEGCVDLVLAGHLHEQVGPTEMTGTNGKVGYSYTNGTTGGAAYALAIGSKLRRDAEVTLVTYADGVPVGLQPVVVSTIWSPPWYQTQPLWSTESARTRIAATSAEESSGGMTMPRPESIRRASLSPLTPRITGRSLLIASKILEGMTWRNKTESRSSTSATSHNLQYSHTSSLVTEPTKWTLESWRSFASPAMAFSSAPVPTSTKAMSDRPRSASAASRSVRKPCAMPIVPTYAATNLPVSLKRAARSAGLDPA